MDKSIQKFRESVTSVAFSLQLSRNQIAAMHQVAMDNFLHDNGMMNFQQRAQTIGHFSHFIVGVRKLERLGLVTHEYNPNQLNETAFKLTEVGNKVHELLVMAGLTPELKMPANEPA